MAIKLHSSFAVHPGTWLRAEIIEPHDLTVTDAAAKLHVTRQAMSNLLGGRAGLSAEMAIRFEKAFGLSADTLMRIQAAHDLAEVRARAGSIEVERVAAYSATALEEMP
jgi:addiction module HigA family antidote